jgi:hypothetical protein
MLHQAFVLGCAEHVEVIRYSPVDSLTATETGPQQDFNNTEMSLRPRRGLSIRFGRGRLAIARRGVPKRETN